jgi:hypothetical protein
MIVTAVATGAVLTADAALTSIVNVLFASDPSTLTFPAASENLLLATLTVKLGVLLVEVPVPSGVNVAV